MRPNHDSREAAIAATPSQAYLAVVLERLADREASPLEDGAHCFGRVLARRFLRVVFQHERATARRSTPLSTRRGVNDMQARRIL